MEGKEDCEASDSLRYWLDNATTSSDRDALAYAARGVLAELELAKSWRTVNDEVLLGLAELHKKTLARDASLLAECRAWRKVDDEFGDGNHDEWTLEARRLRSENGNEAANG
jgi:hypothetical protein